MIDWDDPESPEARAALAEAERLDAIYADIEQREADERDRGEREGGGLCGECERGLPSWQQHGSLCPECEDDQVDEMVELRRAALDGRGRP